MKSSISRSDETTSSTGVWLASLHSPADEAEVGHGQEFSTLQIHVKELKKGWKRVEYRKKMAKTEGGGLGGGEREEEIEKRGKEETKKNKNK